VGTNLMFAWRNAEGNIRSERIGSQPGTSYHFTEEHQGYDADMWYTITLSDGHMLPERYVRMNLSQSGDVNLYTFAIQCN
jgi:hypothetical protein